MKALFESTECNALLTALIKAAETWSGTAIDAGQISYNKELVYQYIESSPSSSLIVELVDELHRIGYSITPST